ncbi:hypothetical protein AAGW05_16855 [Arthrobacter sp. LAPM80]|uniref:hypothetical protein n=1 Tax=Arthrobacter sp. LAPM80 TaxID=3141788 RepID=UPI00398B1028
MYVYSRWLLTDGNRKTESVIAAFAAGVGGEVGGSEPEVVEGEGGSLIRRIIEYDDLHSSEWDATPTTRGRWIIGVGNIAAKDGLGSRLVGILTPSASLTEHLAADLADCLEEEHEPVVFSLNAFLQSTEEVGSAHASSVRLVEDSTRVLVQSNDHEALRAMVNDLRGNPVGVTIRGEEGKVTITDGGSVIFSDSTSATTVLGLMNAIVDVHAIPVSTSASVRA